MNPASSAPDAARPDPELEGLWFDAARGEGDEAAAGALAARAALPAGDAGQRRLEVFWEAVREAHAVAPDAELARAISARVRATVAREEAHAEPVRRRRLLWARLVAASVAVHVVLLSVLALRIREGESAAQPVRITVSLPRDPLAGDPERPDEPLRSPWLPDPDEALDLPVPPQVAAPEEVEPALTDLAPLPGRRYDHPPGSLGPMLLRTEDARKRVRLQGLGLDADATLRAVARGLAALERRQAPDGSFAAAGGRSAYGETALALLPFLGDGHGSRTGARQEPVGRGVAWLRARTFRADATVDLPAAASVAEAGMALKALAEDYVLSYGNLGPREAARRAEEVRALADHVARSQGPDGSFPGAVADLRLAVWPMWGLDAAARTGVVLPPAIVAERFARWFSTQDQGRPRDDAAGLLLARHLGERFRRDAARRAERVASEAEAAGDDPFVIATVGTALLREDPDAFRTWSRGIGERLARRLLATGVVREGDEVGDTALVLLALQAAYRTY